MTITVRNLWSVAVKRKADRGAKSFSSAFFAIVSGSDKRYYVNYYLTTLHQPNDLFNLSVLDKILHLRPTALMLYYPLASEE